MRKVLETLNFSEMLRRYFKPDGDEGVSKLSLSY